MTPSKTQKLTRMQEQVSKKFNAKTRPPREDGGRLLTKVNKMKRESK